MFRQTESTLNSLGRAYQSYLKNFEDNGMDDETVAMCIQKGKNRAALALSEVISLPAHRISFILAFPVHLPEPVGTTDENNNSEPSKNFCTTSVCGGKQSSVLANCMESYGNIECPVPSNNDSLETVLNFGLESQESLNPSIMSSARCIQIMELEPVAKRNSERKIIFFEDEFHRVINKCCPNRPVAVLAVAGKGNKGKPLFLSYVLRYLKALKHGSPDWMGWNDTTAKPSEGFRWASYHQVVSKGIWIWSEPITCKNSKGQEFDVLLMDIQEAFDESTGEKEWAILAGIALLTSSVLALNTRNGIPQDTLTSLRNLLSFGILALNRHENSARIKLFQNLVFLVHDWENNKQFPFGNEGGRKFIEKKLEETPGHEDSHRKSQRRGIKACFENIDCFLFPTPGRVTKGSSFTGSVVNASPEYTAFARQMQLCIERLVNPDNFPFKTLNGNILNASAVFEMFKSCVKMFNLKAKPFEAAVIPPSEFKGINDQVLEERAVNMIKKPAKLTPSQAEQLQQSLQPPCSKSEEDNGPCIPKHSHSIGIDLGTKDSCVAVYVNGKVEIIQENGFTIPSCVYYGKGKTTAVGEAAQDGAFKSPENFIFDVKRLIGRSWDENVVQDDIKQWNFNVAQVDGQPRIKCRAGVLRPEEVSAEVLAHLKSLAEKHLGHKVTTAVVTVPAYFNPGQRQATKDAATMAGLSAKILTEPVAAAIAYKVDRDEDMNKNVLVFDLGGGTFDVAVLTISGGNIDVKTINGDTHLGAEDFDKAMAKHVIDKVKARTGRDLLQGINSSNPETRRKVQNTLHRLKLECERKKRHLSSLNMVHIRLEDLGWNLNETMTRSEFEKLINRDLEKCMKIVQTAIEDAEMSKNDINDVILVGGSTKIPKVQKMLKDYFSGIQLKHTVNPCQAVAYGAAIYAAIKVDTTQENGLRNQISVQDCTPSSIGIRNKINGAFLVQIPKGSKVPVSRKQGWTPRQDRQNRCSFDIYEGESPMADDNNLLGKFELHVPPVGKDEAELETTTVIDDEGILRVKAVFLLHGTQSRIKVDNYKGRMSKEEIERRRVDIAQRHTYRSGFE